MVYKRIKFKLINCFSKLNNIDLLAKKLYVFFLKTKYRFTYKSLPMVNHSFLFMSFSGKMAADSPWAIYKYLLLNNIGNKYIWVLTSDKHPMYKYLLSQEKTKVVIFSSKAANIAFATTNYWIVNCNLPLIICKKEKQIYVQCWHGTPLKKIGYDNKHGHSVNSSKLFSYYRYQMTSCLTDYFISPSKYSSECFVSSFGLDKSKILEVGYPRNDELVIYNNSKIETIKRRLGLNLKSKIILYAPTWRDHQYCDKKLDYILENPLEDSKFLDSFDEDIIFLYRGHYFTSLSDPGNKFIDVSAHNNVNEILLISDILITDYSSIFFDFSLLNRPIYFYMYDKPEYEGIIRGFYLDIDNELPGLNYSSKVDLAKGILSNEHEKVERSKFKEKFTPYEDGNSTERVVKSILTNINN